MEATDRDFTINWREVDGDRVPYGRLVFRAIRQEEEFPVDEANHRMWFRASTPGDPGDGLDISVSAWKAHIEEYLEKNPAFVWGHQYISEGFPSIQNVLGHAVDYRLIDDGDEKRDGLYLLDDFAYDVNPIAKMAWHMYQRRDLNAVSVGWDTLEYHTEHDDETGRDKYVIDTAYLLEHSGCILPMDPNALAQGRAVDARSYMLSKIEEYGDMPDLVDGLKRVLGDAYCSDLFCNRLQTRPGWDETDKQYRYRIKDPDAFDKDTFKALSMDVKAEGDVQVVRGKLTNGDDEMHAQSIRFSKDAGWTLADAKDWWADHKNDVGRDRVVAPDRIGKILERLERLEVRFDRITTLPKMAHTQAVVRYDVPEDLRELVESYRGLDEGTLRNKARQMIDDMHEELDR